MIKIESKNQIGIKGAYEYQLIDNSTGDVITDVPEQSNLILDAYLDQQYVIPNNTYLCIGAGVVTPPTVTDTDLGNQIKGTSCSFSPDNDFNTAQGTVGNYGALCKFVTTRDFTGFNGELVSEIGVRLNSTSGPLVTRALIKDASGNPVSIQVNPGQTLRLTYSLYVFIPAIISSGTVGTPHGDLSYVYKLRSYYDTKQVADSARYADWNGSSTNNFRLNGTNATNTVTTDIANRKQTMTVYSGPINSDRPFEARFIEPRLSSTISYMPCFELVGSYTLPANYDFFMEWEITWGRLP